LATEIFSEGCLTLTKEEKKLKDVLRASMSVVCYSSVMLRS